MAIVRAKAAHRCASGSGSDAAKTFRSVLGTLRNVGVCRAVIAGSRSAIRRIRADKLLVAMVEVAKDINADTAMPHYVRKLSVFGCYLGPESMLTQLSLAYDLGTRRAADPRNEALIVACMKLRKGISLCRQRDLDDAGHLYRVIFDSEDNTPDYALHVRETVL